MKKNAELMPNLTKDVVSGVPGFKLESFLVALEGWRRGLTLKWYKDESNVCKMHRLGSSTQGKFFSLSSKVNTHYFFRSRGDKVKNEAVRICTNKEKTKSILDERGVPTPKGIIFQIDDNQIYDYAVDLGFPVVIKPLNGSMGRGVYTNITSVEELSDALKDSKNRFKYKQIIMEKHYNGKEYRVYVVGDKVVGATNRVPANVQGDGVHTIKDLIEMKNREREYNPYLKHKLIKVNYEAKLALKRSDLSLTSVLADGELLSLSEKSNLSTGGDHLEATDELSEEVKQIAVDTLKVLPSIPHAGVDLIVDPYDNKKAVVLEVNATAEISGHLFPWEGRAKDIPSAIIDFYFPETKGVNKSSSYFDYHSLIEPLKTWAANEVTVTTAPDKDMYAKQFNVKGKVQKVGYMSFIKRQALKREMYGYSKKIGNNEVEVIVMGPDIESLSSFKDICYKGSKKSKVESVIEKEEELIKEPYKIGFEIL